MSKYRLVGLESILVGAVNTTTFAMPATSGYTTISNIVPGTAHLALELPSKNKYFTEDSDYADIVITEEGAKMVEFATRDMASSIMTLAFGGSYNTTTLVWSAPTDPRGVIEKALRLTSKTYSGAKFRFDIPRAEFSGGGDLRFSNKGATEPGVINFQAEVMTGENSTGNVAPITRTQI